MAQLALETTIMDATPRDLDNLVQESITRARAAGLDTLAAARNAAQAVRRARPDLTPDEAHALVDLLSPTPDDRRAA